ncbi:AMIN-like domain-containing (lipo)protein [Nostocoides vanveenii]|uniref:AMIN-like domain-containing (lipo)protein n=1 Tax=Nostocoides vanveenii TaxID=330835 RepID=UPI0031E423FA
MDEATTPHTRKIGEADMTTITRRITTLGAAAALAVSALAGASATAAPASAPAAGTSALCHYGWGSLPKVSATMVAGPLTNLRAGKHTCFDRLVVDVRGSAPGYRVEYVDQIIQDGSGTIVPVRGGAKIKITVNAPSYDGNGQIVYQPANPKEAVNVTGYAALRQVRWLGSFEGTSEFGVGVRARTPFRVTKLTDAGTSRLIIDIAHNW